MFVGSEFGSASSEGARVYDSVARKTWEKIPKVPIKYWELGLWAWYYSSVEYPFPPVGIVGAADGKNRRAFLFTPKALVKPQNLLEGRSGLSLRKTGGL